MTQRKRATARAQIAAIAVLVLVGLCAAILGRRRAPDDRYRVESYTKKAGTTVRAHEKHYPKR